MTCGQSHWCTLYCHLLDWPAHLRICQSFAQSTGTSPSGAFRLACFFRTQPRYLLWPQLIWLRVYNPPPGEGVVKGRSYRTIPFIPTNLIGNKPELHELVIEKNVYRKRPLGDHQLHVWFRGNRAWEERNLVLGDAAGGFGELGVEWRGPVVLTRSVKDEFGIERFVNLRAADFRDFVDWLKRHGKEPDIEQSVPREAPEMKLDWLEWHGKEFDMGATGSKGGVKDRVNTLVLRHGHKSLNAWCLHAKAHVGSS